mgnify:CR=1 FL=1
MATFDQKRLRAGAAQCFIPTSFGPASAQKEVHFLVSWLHDLGNCASASFAHSTATSPTAPGPEVSGR